MEMKKIAMLLLVCVVGFGVFVFSGCGGKDSVTGGTGLPSGWDANWVSTPNALFHTWHVGDTVKYALVVYDEQNNTVTDYDTSSTTWRIEQNGNIATLSDATGAITYVTAQNSGTFTLYCNFKGIEINQNITVNP
jgi:hypothetical protein